MKFTSRRYKTLIDKMLLSLNAFDFVSEKHAIALVKNETSLFDFYDVYISISGIDVIAVIKLDHHLPSFYDVHQTSTVFSVTLYGREKGLYHSKNQTLFHKRQEEKSFVKKKWNI